jgi:hypothetical protein
MKKNRLPEDYERMLDHHDRVTVVILYTCFVILCLVAYILMNIIR